MKKKTSFRIRPVRTVIYLLFYGITFLMFYILRNYMWLEIALLMTILPCLSIGSLIFMAKHMKCYLRFPRHEAFRKEFCPVFLCMDNPTWGCSLNGAVTLAIENLFYHSKADFQANLPVQIHHISEMKLPFQMDRNGIVRVSVKKIEIQDLLGLVAVGKMGQEKDEVVIYPETKSLEMKFSYSYIKGVEENAETQGIGTDMENAGQVRQYIPGDRWKDVHWKLSAKKDEILVNEKENNTQEKYFITLDLTGNHRQIDEIITYGYDLCQDMLGHHLGVTFLWWSSEKQTVRQEEVYTIEQLQSVYVMLYNDNLFGTETVSLMSVLGKSMPSLQSFLLIQAQGEQIEAKVIANGMDA